MSNTLKERHQGKVCYSGRDTTWLFLYSIFRMVKTLVPFVYVVSCILEKASQSFLSSSKVCKESVYSSKSFDVKHLGSSHAGSAKGWVGRWPPTKEIGARNISVWPGSKSCVIFAVYCNQVYQWVQYSKPSQTNGKMELQKLLAPALCRLQLVVSSLQRRASSSVFPLASAD